jgi:5'-3' exonuclease
VNVYLIDGTYELFRAFYAAPSLKSPAGREVGATRVLLRSFALLLREHAVTHVACAFDHVIESFRNELFSGYKTGEGIDSALYDQFELAERATHALGIVTWPMIEFEADDALATAAAHALGHPDVERIFVCSPDKDLAQCVRADKVVLFDRLRRKILDEAAVCEKFGVPPAAIPDFLALVGDSADGIPGIAGWGAKSAAALLAHYGSLERIPSDPAAWAVSIRGADKLARVLDAERPHAELYKRLATLRLDVPLAESLDDLAYGGARRAELSGLCEELGFTSFLGSIDRFRPE